MFANGMWGFVYPDKNTNGYRWMFKGVSQDCGGISTEPLETKEQAEQQLLYNMEHFEEICNGN